MDKSKVLDMLDRELKVGDHVVFHNNIYRVHSLPIKPNGRYSNAKIMLHNPSKTTKPVSKTTGDMCLIPEQDFLAWKIRIA